MSTNPFNRLRALLPSPPVLVVTVLEQNADGTSTVQMPSGIGTDVIFKGLNTGASFRVRGTSVAVGHRAFVRAGAIENEAPSGAIGDVVIGAVAALPFGPLALSLASTVVAPGATRTVPYLLDLAQFWANGYSPRAYTLVGGSLPAGLSLSAAAIAGMPTVLGAATGLIVACEDSTHRIVVSAPFSIVVV